MGIRAYITERIRKNSLPIDVDQCLETIRSYRTVYPDVADEKLFFYYILNSVGAILAAIDMEQAEHLGWLRVRGRDSITFYEFEEEEDYYAWLAVRPFFYERIKDHNDMRILNFLDLSIINYIQDIETKRIYTLVKPTDLLHPKTIQKTGYGTDQAQERSGSFLQRLWDLLLNRKTERNEKQSFIKYIVAQFTDGYVFIPSSQKVQ
jgi:hypothetical protein